MKVIEAKPFHVCECPSCKSKLEASLSDLRVGYFDGSFCEDGDRRLYFNCPICGENIRLPQGKETSLANKHAELNMKERSKGK